MEKDDDESLRGNMRSMSKALVEGGWEVFISDLLIGWTGCQSCHHTWLYLSTSYTLSAQRCLKLVEHSVTGTFQSVKLKAFELSDETLVTPCKCENVQPCVKQGIVTGRKRERNLQHRGVSWHVRSFSNWNICRRHDLGTIAELIDVEPVGKGYRIWLLSPMTAELYGKVWRDVLI